VLVVFALAGVSGCSDEEDGACLGFALECGQREPAQCKQGYDGCAVLNGQCGGTAHGCASFSSRSECQPVPNCRWQSH
jgi:hypothetical protein